MDEMRVLREEQQSLLTSAGKRPAVKSKARARWDEITDLLTQKMAEWTELDKAERSAKGQNAPVTPTPVAAPVTPAAPVAKPAVAAKPTPKATPAKAPKAPAPAVTPEAVETETAEEEAARKREAEEFKRRLEALEKKVEKPAPKAEAPAPKAKEAEKPTTKEIPEKLREPVGTSEFGMEEGEKEIQRGPQGMLFPMSKREEIEYAERKQRGEAEPEAQAPTTKDERQAELDFNKVPEPQKAQLEKPFENLTETQKQKLENFYGEDRNTNAFWDNLRADVVKSINDGSKAVAKAIREIVDQIVAGVLAVGIVFNPAALNNQYNLNVSKTFKETIALTAEVPEAAKTKMSPLAQDVYTAMAPVAMKSGKWFMVADKPNGMLHIFKEDGSHALSDPTLYGKDAGDVLGKVSSLEGGPKITPAGKFTLREAPASGYAGETSLVLVESRDYTGYIAIHAADTGTPSENRLGRLETTAADDNRISYGCINTKHSTFVNKIKPNISKLDGGMIFVLPDATETTAGIFKPEAQVVERTETPTTAKTEGTREVTKKEEKVEGVEGLMSVAIAEGQTLNSLKEEIKTTDGVLGTALRRMVASGKVVLEDAHPSGKKIGGFYDGEKVTLYANGIPSGQSMAVALHEVGAHLGMEKLLGKKQYNAVIDRILDMVATGDGSAEAKMAQAAYKRIPVSDFKRGVGRDEMVAYFVEEMAKAEVAGTLPKIGPLRIMWNRVRNAIVTALNKTLGTKFGINDLSAQDILDIAKSSFVAESKTEITKGEAKELFSVSYSAEKLIDSMGPMSRDAENAVLRWVNQARSEPDIGYVTKFRTQVTDVAATIEKRLSDKFDGAVRDSMGKLNPMGLYRQAQDYTKMLLEYFQTGTLYKDSATGLWMSGMGKGVRPPAEVYALLDKYAEKNGYSRDRATQIASRVLEGVRLNEMRKSNKAGITNFALHLKDNDIDLLLQEYNADPDLKEMSKLMDEARIAMVNNLVSVGRLSKEQGDEWKSVVGYVPFDRLEDFATKYSSAKKISGKGISQLGKLPELIGSEVRPVGNVFDNYINTLGWMVGQTLKTDATVQTLRSLENFGAKKLGNTSQGKPNVVSAYVDGELNYWSVPSKYDVMAFKDLNPPKAGWLRAMGAFSNVLRKTVTVLPPFALKQVADDVQRAILTSGVKNPGALIWMSLTNFPKLVVAELRGIQHPIVRDFGRLGLTGEYDFEAGKPAASLLKDLGYKKRGKFEEIIHRLDGITRASDLAVRKAIYDQTMKESMGDTLLAQTRAREFINFRRRGANDFVGVMVTTIPFFNAYIQGMDVLYRAASGKDSSSSVDRAQARQLFWTRAGTVFMLSSLYALGKDDEDEDYKEMDLRTRDSNWILGGGYKIGVPGELGAIFKVIPERIVEYMKRQGTPEEQTAFEAMRTTLSYMFEQYLGRAVPVPQAIKPVLEAWSNKSFLTGKDLEGYHHRAMDPSLRKTEQTSELAKAIAVFSRDQIGVEVSPIMIDNSLRGYFGSSAALLTMVTDSLLNPTRIDRPLHKYALLSNYLYDPVGTRRMTEFYEEREKVGKANTTLNELIKTDLTRAEKYVEEHIDELQLEGAVNSTLEQLERTRAYRKFLNSPDSAAEMSKDERESELKELKKIELELVNWVREAKTELRKVQ
jgi:hypothetical protein